MDITASDLHPPFNITRMSHLVLTAHDLERSTTFYTQVIGMVLSDRTADRVYLRGIEELAHHSLVLERSDAPAAARRLGFRVFLDDDLERAHAWLGGRGCAPQWIDVPHQGRTLAFVDNSGTPVELCASMDQCERTMNKTTLHRGAPARRLDHVQIYVPDVEASFGFYAALGFRASEYIETDGRVSATFLYRKGNTHDLVLFSGAGPQIHHFGMLVSDGAAILHACDLAGDLGFGATIDRGPGRHGLDGSLFVYFRDPDGHRVELFDGHYQTIDSDLPPRRWVPSDGRQPWGFPAQESWFTECSPFAGVPVQRPEVEPKFFSLEQYLAAKKAVQA